MTIQQVDLREALAIIQRVQAYNVRRDMVDTLLGVELGIIEAARIEAGPEQITPHPLAHVRD